MTEEEDARNTHVIQHELGKCSIQALQIFGLPFLGLLDHLLAEYLLEQHLSLHHGSDGERGRDISCESRNKGRKGALKYRKLQLLRASVGEGIERGS
ncbi:hypothetical protein VNO77_41776 [Canavalia gladiata]|uniref:Uncharacterized protein n=1 Tax=Canavalia gladiata TaxID=3824 RepID=A0AAN9PSA0_CANGL